MSPAKFEICVPSDIQIKRSSASPTLCVDITLVSMRSFSGTSSYLSLPTRVGSVHFGKETFWWHIAVKATLRGINKMLGV
jgi:hypothetical protein